MIEAGQLVRLFTDLLAWLKRHGEARERDRERFHRALLSVYLAANETKAYLATLRRRRGPDHERERALSRMWSEAAVALQEFDPELADRSLLEGHYWADPTEWSDAELERARESLKALFSKARELLQPR